MVKILNKICFHLKNIVLPITLIVTIYIVMYMFQRLEKELFGANFLEFIKIIAPYLLLIILSIINLFLKQESVKENTFYNITSLLVVATISVFCYRALFDQNMLFWHKYGYNINFNYFSDQLAPIKVMLYGLSIANLLLMFSGLIKKEEDNSHKNIAKK